MFLDHTAVAVSVLALELAAGNVESCRTFLAERGVQICADGLGRAAISHNDARKLISERAAQLVEVERRRREITARQ